MREQQKSGRAKISVAQAFERGREAARQHRSFNSVLYRDRHVVRAWEEGYRSEQQMQTSEQQQKTEAK